MLKICHITSAHPRYDIRIFVKECVTLASVGHDVTLIVADELADEIKQGIKIYSVGKSGSRYSRMRETPQKIYHKILELNPDIVHFHDPELMQIGLKLAKAKFRVVYDVHEDVPKQIMSKHWLPKIVRPVISKIVQYFEQHSAKKFYGVIAATPIIEQRFKSYNPNTVSICNYPLLAELNIVDNPWSQREDKLCYIGSISKTRGIVPLVKSLAISKLPLQLAGPFSGDISLTELKELPGGEYINYLGVLRRKQIVELLQKVKIGLVTLLPTPSYLESLPIKMFEYMLSGIPVVASNFPLWQEIIKPCGLVVDPTDDIAIAKACKWLLDNQKQAMQMGLCGKKIVEETFNWEHESLKLINFYPHQ